MMKLFAIQPRRHRVCQIWSSHSEDWLNTPPLKALGLHLRPVEFVLASKYRLGKEVYSRAGPCPACLRPSDPRGDHAMSCGTGGERIARHNHLRDALFEMAVSAGLGPTKEGRFLLPGDDWRPADVFIPYGAGGRDAALDMTVVNPPPDSNHGRSGHNPRTRPILRLRKEDARCRRRLPETRHSLPATGSRVPRWLAWRS